MRALLAIPAALCLAGCTGTVKTYDPQSGTVTSDIRVPPGSQWNDATRTLSADPVAVEAGRACVFKALEVGGEAFAVRVADNLAKQAPAQ